MPIIQAVERALKILDLFDEQETELKITEISERMQLHKSTVHSLLKTLQAHGYIDQNPENGKYRLGMKLFERGNFVIHGLDIRKIAKRHLVDLSLKTGQTTHLVILDDKEGVYIDKVEGPMATILYSRIGRRIPVHSSAVGKVLVAFLSEEELQNILDGYQYVAQTPNTITNEQAFRQELEKVRQAGYAVDNQENEPGVRCIAVPIRNHKGHVVAAVSISTLVSRVDDQTLMEFLGMLKPAAEEMSQQMGYGIASRHP
ncbi:MULTISPECIES: IclR family transcriptional regulator [Brevibacillus]|jgi:DNA-binding IclR family transcriptional regulator|uniref:Glycerol operon regulatory protein n=1 Tax=Brevibacillus thermoruber TaxID=33942 RepID=A0A9X3Z2W2_9BACL|nr:MULTISPECIES: IclR family transcriptional regulator [Brevibacillus]MDA5108020.1 IclR family transcriptional regulator [Brevibacillus thermoruber]TRY26638.1 IclR family transcriptional regulator [Brevibacillus sp. LEMMJ03]UYZ15318.1 IclR family transcriptional regulator [Brevibacillus sp. WF146]